MKTLGVAKPNWSVIVLVAAFMIISLGGGFIGGYVAAKYGRQNLSTSAQKEIISSESNLISQIAQDVGPSVVSVNVTSAATSARSQFYGISEQESAGTGFIVSTDGVIVTNRHVVPAATTKVSVVLSDGTKLDDVEVIGRTNDSDPLDIAFLKIKDAKGKELKPAKLGDSSKMRIGDKVVAIGNALGQFQNTVTSGIISGFGRDVEASDASGNGTEQLQDLFQTDAAINQGNSGGPLVNMNGEVIGVNTAVAGDAQNIGFAIPVNDIAGLVKSVLASGKLERPYLGVRYVSLTDDFAAENNLSVKRGAYVLKTEDAVIPGSPAALAGIKPGDIITKVNDKPVDEDNNLSNVLARFGVGETVKLTVIRDGQEQQISATLTAAPQS